MGDKKDNRIMQRIRIVTTVIFMIILVIPLALQQVYLLTGKKIDLSLLGYSDNFEKPPLTIESYLDTTYQTNYENWYGNSFIPRGFLIKNYNQIRYSAFSLSNEIVGKNDDIFEESYILDAIRTVDYASDDNYQAIQTYVNQLEEIDSKLRKMNKYLLYYTTPSKGIHDYENIPYRYGVRASENNARAIDVFRDMIKKTNVVYLDSEDLIKDCQYPIFYTTGIHWACPIEQEMTVQIFNTLSEISGKNLRTFSLGDMEIRDDPFWRETDVYNLTNIYQDPRPMKYYQYQMSPVFPEKYDNFSAFIEGGSFAEGFTRFSYKTDNVWQTFYNDRFRGINDDVRIDLNEDWNNVNLGEYLDKVDFVIIESNEQFISNFSNGFVEYLDHYLDTYVPKDSSDNSYPEKIDSADSSYNDLSSSKGYYGVEDGFFGAEKESVITLKNDKIDKAGLRVSGSLPDCVIDANGDKAVLYVDGKKVYDSIINQSGSFDIIIPSAELETDDNVYQIEMFFEKDFIPSKIGLNSNTGPSAVQIRYIGER